MPTVVTIASGKLRGSILPDGAQEYRVFRSLGERKNTVGKPLAWGN